MPKQFANMFVALILGLSGGSILYLRAFPNISSSPLTVSHRTSSSIAALEERVYAQVNQYRTSRNLPPLQLDAKISAEARNHSTRMARRGEISQDGFEERVKAIAREIPYSRVAENIAYNSGNADPAKVAVEGWINSTGYRQNLTGNFDLTGIGIARNDRGEYYFTQILIKSPRSIAFAVLEERVHAQVNQYRASRNLPPLKLDAIISEEARKHSRRMARRREISHDGFEERVKAIGRWIPYGAAAENVASNSGHDDPATVALEGWIKSPGHHQNMIGDFDLTGIAIVENDRGEYYFTQVFIKGR
ncbi:MAG: CAP domain-containing protein [Hormoscilla sp. SP5CHS1]|nr:CAP domain-containing protein [Hormoscilla sp. SP5CHS1]